MHPIRNTFKLGARQHWAGIARDLRPIYTALNEPEARRRFEELCDTWGDCYPAMRGLWERAWPEFVPFS